MVAVLVVDLEVVEVLGDFLNCGNNGFKIDYRITWINLLRLIIICVIH